MTVKITIIGLGQIGAQFRQHGLQRFGGVDQLIIADHRF